MRDQDARKLGERRLEVEPVEGLRHRDQGDARRREAGGRRLAGPILDAESGRSGALGLGEHLPIGVDADHAPAVAGDEPGGDAGAAADVGDHGVALAAGAGRRLRQQAEEEVAERRRIARPAAGVGLGVGAEALPGVLLERAQASAVTLSSTAIGVGSPWTPTVVRVGWICPKISP